LGISVVATHPIEPTDNLPLFALLGDLFGAQEAASRLSVAFQSALANLHKAAGNAPEQRVLYMIWKDPWMTVSEDTYIAKMLKLVNWRTVGGQPGTRYPEVALDKTTLETVDRILLSTEPFEFTKTHCEELKQQLSHLPVPVSLIDGEMTSWYGSRAIQGVEYLRRLVA